METSVGKEQQHIGLGWVAVALAGWVWPWLGGCGLWFGECGLDSVGVALDRYILRLSEMTHHYTNSLVS